MVMNTSYRAFAFLAGITALSACVSLNPIAAIKLSRVDPLTFGPDKLTIAAVLPATLKLRNGDVVLNFSLDAPAPYGPIDEDIPLEIISGTPNKRIMAKPSIEHVQLARLAADDVPRLAAAQAKAREFRRTGRKDGKGSISVTIVGGCRVGQIDGAALIASIYMQISPEEEFFPTATSLDLRTALGSATIENFPSC